MPSGSERSVHSVKVRPSKTNGKTQGCEVRGPERFVLAHLRPLARVDSDPGATSWADAGGVAAEGDSVAVVAASRDVGEQSQYSQLPCLWLMVKISSCTMS